MAYTIVRIFDSEERARDAERQLLEDGFPKGAVFVVTPPGGEGEAGAGAPELASRALMAGRALGEHADIYAERVAHGRSLVVVEAEFGFSRPAMEILDACGPVDTEVGPPAEPTQYNEGTPFSEGLYLPVLARNRPAPFSGLIGLPPVVHGRTTFGTLTDPHFTFSSLFGLKLLTRAAAPFSSLFGMKTLITPKRPWNKSLGLPILAGKAAPFSSMLGLRLLIRKPAPLSSLLGMRTLLPEPR